MVCAICQNVLCNKRSETKCKITILHKILDFLFKAQSGSRARRCRRNATIVHVCMEVNAKKDGIDISVNVNTPAFLDLLVEMVCLIKIVFIISSEIIQIVIYMFNRSYFIHLFVAAATLRFQGNNSMSLKYDQSVEHEADDLIFRFRSVEQNGLLMSSRHDRSSDRLEVTLDAGRIKIFIHV